MLRLCKGGLDSGTDWNARLVDGIQARELPPKYTFSVACQLAIYVQAPIVSLLSQCG